MYYLKLSTFILVASVSLSCLDELQAAPTRSSELSKDQRTPSSVWKSWMIPVLRKRSLTRVTPAFPEEELFKEKSIHVNKRTCNTATCVTQRLADFLSRSDKNLGPFYIPTNVGSNTYGKRDSVGSYSRDPLNYLQL